MATTYNDIIKKRSGRAAYSIEEEKANQWETFIPNEQFNAVLNTVLNSVRGNDIDKHKSFWIRGTYGTGKSHAVAVITHLLCDPIEDIRKWVDYEYQAPKFETMRKQIYSLRQNKRLLPVKLEGLCDMSHVTDLPLVIQTAVVKALKVNGLEIVVDTDYDELIKHIKENPVIWDDLISRFAELRSIVPTREKLIQKLTEKDMATYQKAKTAQRNANINIILSQENIASWLIEVQEKLRAETDYKGLLILWDEFTDVMSDNIGISVLKALQTIVQKFANDDNDSFFFLISHPSAFDKLSNEETKQTDGRYHRMMYNMESVSAFKIMSRKFEITDPERHERMRNFFYTRNNQLLDLYTQFSNDPQETRQDLLNLFPLHPATANLATHYATVVGSSSRSVFEFIGQNDAMEGFLANEEAFANRYTVTADYLWDFVLKVFQDDVTNYAAVTERFNTYRTMVAERGTTAYAVFKGILLLNAFNNISGQNNNDLVTPSEDNIRNLFVGTQYEDELDEVFDWFNDQSVIQRAPGGIFSVQFSALPSHEIEEQKELLRTGDYRYISKVLSFGDTAKNYFERKYVQKLIRPYSYGFFGKSNNDALLRDQIKKAKRGARPSDLFLALLFSKNNTEVTELRQFAQEASKAAKESDEELRDIVFIVFDVPFGDKEYTRFIEYMANYTAAQAHGFMDQVNVHMDHAAAMIKNWLEIAQRGNATISVNGLNQPFSVKHLSSVLNDVIAPIIFPYGPDAVEILRKKSPNTFWSPRVSKEIIRAFIFYSSKSELSQLVGQMRPVQYLIQDVLDENFEWKTTAQANHPFRAVYDFVQNKIKLADKSLLFNFAEKFDELRKPPYGLSANYASAAMVAFALRKWANKIFDNLGKPRDNNDLVSDIGELFGVWEKGKSSNKLSFKFQTPEEDMLCKALVKTFKLNKLKGYNQVTSLKDARFCITGPLVEEKGYPLWSLKYMDQAFCTSHPAIVMNDNIRRLIDNIVTLCSPNQDLKDSKLNNETLQLISKYRVDLPDILAKPGNFGNGFDNFLLSQPGVGLKISEIEDAIDYIKKHLESTIGYWTEEEVANALKDWRIAENTRVAEERRQEEEERRREEERERIREREEEKKRQEEERRRIEDERRAHEEELRRREEEIKRHEEARKRLEEEQIRLREEAAKAKEKAKEELKGKEEVVDKKKIDAKEYINSLQTLSELRKVLDEVINMGYEFVIDKILESIKER